MFPGLERAEGMFPFSCLYVVEDSAMLFTGLLTGRGWDRHYLPMQKVEKIRLRMSSLVVVPVRSSRARRDS